MFAKLHAPVPSLNGAPFPFAPTHLQRRGHTPDARQCSVHHPCCLGAPNASGRGTKSEVAHKWADWVYHPCPLGPKRFKGETKSEVAHEWAWWLYHLCPLGAPQGFTAGDKIRTTSVATSPLPCGGVPNTLDRVGWAYVGSHHRDTQLQMPLTRTVVLTYYGILVAPCCDFSILLLVKRFANLLRLWYVCQ